YKALEKKWFQNLKSNQNRLLTDNNRVDISELHLYGELGFLLLGSKCCVLIEHLPKELDILNSYIKDVCLSWLEEIGDDSNVKIIKIKDNIKSVEINLSGCYLIVNTRHELYHLVKEYFEENKTETIQENILAKILDYPGSLPSSAEEYSNMIRVGYIEKSTRYWLTTYAGQKQQLNDIKNHFLIYYDDYLAHFDSELELLIEDL
ncbi:hypothetical protein K502DRAFT_283063, partial [Neoconidiobolus thromboides FSU 785]